MDSKQFQNYVLSVLGREFSDRRFTANADPLVISSSDAAFGLQNLYLSYQRDRPSQSDLDTMVVEHFARLLAEADRHTAGRRSTWDEVRPRLRLQLMPAEYRKKIAVLTFPFLDDVQVGIVVDSEAGYAYVREEDASAWGQSPLDMYEVAVENLSTASAGLSMTFVPPPGALIGIEAKDGYDAARILVPRIREFAAEKLGEPFFAAIPNRDFLILWSAQNPAHFQRLVRERVAKDFAEQSYPLTSTVLVVTCGAISPER
jgi:uncharacterized protein YtpQ (UPF0354 family)